MVEYEVIESIGIENFNRDLKEMCKNKFIPFMQHTVYVNEQGKAVYTQLYSKYINLTDTK